MPRQVCTNAHQDMATVSTCALLKLMPEATLVYQGSALLLL
jgi:hypothetical protein